MFAHYPQFHSSHRGLGHKGLTCPQWLELSLRFGKGHPSTTLIPRNNFECRHSRCLISWMNLNVSNTQDVSDTCLPCRPWCPYLPWSQGSHLLPGKRVKKTERWGSSKGEWRAKYTRRNHLCGIHTDAHTHRRAHTQMWNLGKFPCCHRNSWSSFFFFCISKNSDRFLQDFIEIISMKHFAQDHPHHHHSSRLISSIIHTNTAISQKFKVSSFHTVTSFDFWANSLSSPTFSPLCPFRPRTPSAPCDARTDITDNRRYMVFTGQTGAAKWWSVQSDHEPICGTSMRSTVFPK